MRFSTLVGAGCVVAAGMLLGRFSGLARELVLAAHFGMTREADMAMLAISLPDLLNALFLGGAVSAVLIPEVHRLQQDVSRAKAQELVCQFLLVVLVASTVMAGVILLCDDWVVRVLAPGFDSGARRDAARLIHWALLAFPLCTASAVTAAVLQAAHRVAVPACGTLLFNVVVIAGISVAALTSRIEFVGWAVVLGAGSRLAAQLVDCWRNGWFRHGWVSAWRFGGLNREHGVRYFEAIVAVGVAVCLPVIGRAFASGIEGGIACFSYAWKLVELPAGVISALLSMVVFPRLSRFVQNGQGNAAQNLASNVSRFVVIASVPAAVGFVAASVPVISFLFQRGQVTPEQIAMLARLGQIAFFALPAIVLTSHALGGFYAYGDTRWPFVISIAMVVVYPAVMVPLARGEGLITLMAASVVVQWLQFACLATVLRWRHRFSLMGQGRMTAYATLSAAAALSVVVALRLTRFTTDARALLVIATVLALACLVACAGSLRSKPPALRVRSKQQVPGANPQARRTEPVQKNATPRRAA